MCWFICTNLYVALDIWIYRLAELNDRFMPLFDEITLCGVKLCHHSARIHNYEGMCVTQRYIAQGYSLSLYSVYIVASTCQQFNVEQCSSQITGCKFNTMQQ